MAIAGIPEVINDFNLYLSGNKLGGTTGEVALPDFEPITSTTSGNGILGEYEAIQQLLVDHVKDAVAK